MKSKFNLSEFLFAVLLWTSRPLVSAAMNVGFKPVGIVVVMVERAHRHRGLDRRFVFDVSEPEFFRWQKLA